jgi:putative pyruvate formate lyase activating enzyme
MLSSCSLCPRACRVNRLAGQTGFCRAGSLPSVALVSRHRWEEPCLSGSRGAGTVFFANCNLGCVFCQNHAISQEGGGQEITVARLAAIFSEQQAAGAHNLELVTPTHYLPQILEALGLARRAGFALPVVYNTNAYETVDTVGLLAGNIDVYLPDLKYYDDTHAVRYSAAPDYFAHASRAIAKMVELAGPPVVDAAGLMQKGVIVRHLALPGLAADSRRLLEWLWSTFGHDIYLSLMNQYTPLHRAADHREINRRLTTWEYRKLVDYAETLGFENCFVQAGRTASASYVPVFTGDGVAVGNEKPDTGK